MRIKKGDVVKIISGGSEVKGVTGKVLSILQKSQRVVIEGLPSLMRHLKPERSKKHMEGGIIEKPRSVHISNVMLIPEGSNEPTRTGFSFNGETKVRVKRGHGSSAEAV